MTESTDTARRLELADRLQAAVHDNDTLAEFAHRAADAFDLAGITSASRKLRGLVIDAFNNDEKAAWHDALVSRLRRCAIEAAAEVEPNYWRAAIFYVGAVAEALDYVGQPNAAADVRALERDQQRHADACERDGLLRRVERGQATAADAARLRELFEDATRYPRPFGVVGAEMLAASLSACPGCDEAQCDCLAPGQE